jgi:hypothetical protein
MIINRILVRADYCFGANPLELKNLGKVNFIFASNGSGKTTISKALSRQPADPVDRESWSVAPTDLPVRVFNEEYRAQVLTEHVAGIFSIGENSKAIEDEISELENEKAELNREIDRSKYEIEGTDGRGNKVGLRSDIKQIKIDVSEEIFEVYKSLPDAASRLVFSGYRNSKIKLFEEAFQRYSNSNYSTNGESWAHLNQRAIAVQGGGNSRPLLPRLINVELVTNDDRDATARSLASQSNGKLSSLIDRLSNQDWVNKGRQYLAQSEERCPFCQQELDSGFEMMLAEYFSNEFDFAFEKLNRILRDAESKARDLENELNSLVDAVEADSDIDGAVFFRAVASVQKSVELLLAGLREKCERPTISVQLPDIADVIAELNDLIAKENIRINDYNQIIKNATEERNKLISDGWGLFLNEPNVGGNLRRYAGITGSKNQEISRLEASISSKQAEVESVDKRISDLRLSYSNTSEVARKINKLLSAVGFSRFHLGVVDQTKGTYRIIREDGTPAFNSLSEGERSFICFAYFWESLFGSNASGGVPEEVVAVIDDPISSLDSDVLFIVAQFIRDAAIDVINDRTNLRQLIVLTHNTQFHREAAYSNDRGSAHRRYFRLVKSLDGFTTVKDDGGKSKIRGTYALLWDAVVEAARDEGDSALVHVGVCNVVRRIIEWYFKTVGNLKDYRRPSDLEVAEERVVATFHVWANAGSHTIADDVDQTIGVSETKRFLTLFQMYFDMQGHGAHFDMMIEASGGADLLSEGNLFARTRG